MDAQQQAQLAQSNAAKQAPALTPEQMKQQKAMQEAMQKQQEQLQAHINQQIQAGITTYNLDKQREVAEIQKLTLAAQGLESVMKSNEQLSHIVITNEDKALLDHVSRISFIGGTILNGIEKSLGIETLSVDLPSVENVSHETTEESAPVDNVATASV